MTLQVQAVVSMPFAENTYVVWLPQSSEAIVIDPGLQPELIFEVLERERLSVAAILNTHGHADHIGGNAAIKQAFPEAPLVIGAGEVEYLTDPGLNLSASFGYRVTSPPADLTVQDGDIVEFAGIALEVLEIPGHSLGHVAYLHRGKPYVVFGGDILFQGGIGRFDFPGSDGRLLIDGIRGKLLTLPDDTIVYPGHGPATTVGEEKRNNPYVGANPLFGW